MRGPAVLNDGVLLAVDAALQKPVHARHEIIAVKLRMKSDDAASQHPFHNLLLPGTNSKTLGIGPGNVPEHQHRGLREAFANQPGHQREMIILNKDDGIVGIHFLARRIGELPVNFLVISPVFAAKYRACMGQMAERPEPFVGEPVVVALFLFLGKP